MFIVYTEQDLKTGEVHHVRWFEDRIVSCLRHRTSITARTRSTVQEFNHGMDRTEIKHYVPSSRINNQLVQILTTMGTADGRGMTRSQSVAYLKWVLAELDMAVVRDINDDYDLEAVGVVAPQTEPATNRYSYDKWMSWAVDTICDWPSNLFQGKSEGDGQGYLLDKPLKTEEFILRQRVHEAAMWLKLTIPGLKITPRVTDPENGWALLIDRLWDRGPPSQSRRHTLGDPWFLPIYRRAHHQDGNEGAWAAPDDLFSKAELGVVREELKDKLTHDNDGWSFR